MVITGATGAIGSVLMKHYNATAYDPRKEAGFPKCDILINCMGVEYSQYLHKAYYTMIVDTMLSNLIKPMDVIIMALPYMRKMNYGRIINMSSVLANMGVAGTSVYAASKAGLNGAIKAIAIENATHNILINNLNLGYMDLGMTLKIPNYHELLPKIPVGKFGNVEEIIRACDFLIASDYITGSCIDINGGLW